MSRIHGRIPLEEFTIMLPFSPALTPVERFSCSQTVLFNPCSPGGQAGQTADGAVHPGPPWDFLALSLPPPDGHWSPEATQLHVLEARGVWALSHLLGRMWGWVAQGQTTFPRSSCWKNAPLKFSVSANSHNSCQSLEGVGHSFGEFGSGVR